MLRSLEIQNYRNLRHLTIEKLGRVNLLVGKNNTGKTSVLEAVSIIVSRAEPRLILSHLAQRGENYLSFYNSPNKVDSIEDVLRTIYALFTDRIALYNHDVILIRESKNKYVSIKLVRYIDDEKRRGGRMKLIEDENNPNVKISLEISSVTKSGATIYYYGLDTFNQSKLPSYGRFEYEKLDFIRTNNNNRDGNGVLWDAIILTEKEDYVVNALRIIDQNIDRIAYIKNNEHNGERMAVARLKSNNSIIPLQSMGDGMSRIMTIMLAMVNCENGYLLIDEFENGLHYSVQQKLWEIIFYLAERLNIQVFATTHSNDTIKSFSEVSNSKSEYKDAQLIQLRNVKGEISAVLFNSQDVEIATETDYLDLR